MNLTEKEFWKFTFLCLRVLWIKPTGFSLDSLYRCWLTIYTVGLFSWKRYTSYL